jgi:hypothetical protein
MARKHDSLEHEPKVSPLQCVTLPIKRLALTRLIDSPRRTPAAGEATSAGATSSAEDRSGWSSRVNGANGCQPPTNSSDESYREKHTDGSS